MAKTSNVISKKKCSTCTIALLFFTILIILFAIRYLSLPREKFNYKIKYTDPCSPTNFDKKLKHFYVNAKDYRNTEKKMNDAQDTFEKEYNELIKINRKLDESKAELQNCMRY
tara:strand:- start:55 stop:393 length:339 start_codon:yes stop_codon:yes gene_type:complete